jgi:pyruvate formate lyase activating enzyme
MSVEQVMTIIEKDMPFYGESDGGVTFSGGEPLQQPDFLEAVVKECVERNIHVALDTCGYAPSNVMDRFLDKIDLFLYDIKIIDPAKHRKYTGVSNELILENAKRIASEGARLSISIPIIPMINDGEDDIDKTGKFIASLGNVEWVSLLPYHRMGIDKYGNLGKRYRLKDVQTPSHQRMETIKEKLETFGLRVRVEER